jgi:myosin heavy subunit
MSTAVSSIDIWHNARIWTLRSPPTGQWIPGIVNSCTIDDKTAEWFFSIETDDKNKEKLSIKTKAIDKLNTEFEFIKRREGATMQRRVETADLTSLLFLNEPEIIECVKCRFTENFIYTSIGPILIAVNPFQRMPIFGPDKVNDYFKATLTESKSLGPHIYQLSEEAYQKMLVDKYNPDVRENQVILVNGESGAGESVGVRGGDRGA